MCLHKRMSHGLSVSFNHKKHTIASKRCLNRRILLGWFWSNNSDLQSCSNHANKRLPFQILVTIPTAFTHFSWWRVLSSAIRKPENRKNILNRKREITTQWDLDKHVFIVTATFVEKHVSSTALINQVFSKRDVKNRDMMIEFFKTYPITDSQKRNSWRDLIQMVFTSKKKQTWSCSKEHYRKKKKQK